jgi:thiol-disulfide isomerase/thioredoxin/outer membrane lipoprotein-sorting protein
VFMHSIVAAAALLLSFLPQQLPDAETVLKKIAEAAAGRHSFQYSVQINVEAKQAGKPIESRSGTANATVRLINPGKIRIEKQGLAGSKTQISDGEATWTFDAVRKQYDKIAAAPHPTALGTPSFDWLGDLPIGDIQGNSSVLREETVNVDGQDHPCWVLESNLRVPPNQATSVANAVMRFWVDKERAIMLKNEASFSLVPPRMPGQNPPPLDYKVVMIVGSLKIDEPIPGDVFALSAPADYKEVPALSGTGSRVDLTGTVAPSFDVKDLEGKSHSSASLKGKPVFLDFGATWCGPCVESTPVVEKIHEEYKDKGLVTLSVDVGEDRKIVEAFLKPLHLQYPVIQGSDFGMDKAFQVTAYPTFVLIGSDGKIAGHQIGYYGEASLRALVARAGFGSTGTAPRPVTAAAAPDASRPAPSTAALRYSPAAIARDSDGNLYIADSTGARIIKISRGGSAAVIAGNGIAGFSGDGGPAIFASLNQPASIAVDGAGNVYVGDNGNSRIRKIGAGGIITSLSIPQLQQAGGLAVDSAGSLYITETSANRVRKISQDGNVTTIAGTGIPGARGDGSSAAVAQLSSPNGLALDGSGTVYIADTGNHRVRKVTPEGTILLVAGNGSDGSSGDGGRAVLSQLRSPRSVAIDNDGNVYIADASDSRIRKVTRSGNISTLQTQLGDIQSIVIDQTGDIYAVNTREGLLQRINADGTVSPVSGAVPLNRR